ncbi:MAG: CARDB domain-containing protein [Patescibacteria group bacterium]
MAKAQRKFWHGALLIVLVFGIGVGAHFSTGSVSAQDAVQLDLPADSANGDSVRPLESGAKNFSNGIDLGNPLPSGSPGSATQPVPNFSGINAPWWVNSVGPVEVPDDSIFHGLVDVRRGLINNGPLFGAGNAPGNNGTLTIAADAANPNTNIAASPGNTYVDLGSFLLTLTGRTSITVSKFIFTKSGFAPDNNIARLELLSGDIIDGTTIGTTNTSSAGVFTITPGTPISVLSSQGSRKFQLLGDISAAAAVGGDFTLALTALETKDANGNRLTINVNGSNFTLRRITLAAAPKPDLTVDSATQSVAPANPTAGNAATFTVNVKNSGAANADMNTIKSKLCINLGNDAGTTCDTAVTFNHSGTLASNATVAATFAWTPDATQAGNHSFTVCADSTAGLAESNDGNNCSSAKAFSIAAAAGSTVTFTRNPAPLVTEVIPAGAKIPVLLFDGKASSGTSRLSKLYVEPTPGGGSPTLANFILQRKDAGGIWKDLAAVAAASNVGSAAVPRFVLSFSIGGGTANSDISTSNVNFRVLADVACANVPSSIDFIVRRDTDAFFTTAPTVARSGFAPVIRNIAMCGVGGGLPPLGGGGNPLMNSVLGSGMYGASVLGSDSFGTFNFFGDTAKLAQTSTLLEMAVPATGGSVLKNPVTIYDDLYIHGAGTAEEPGDIIIEGAIYAGGTGSLSIASSTQINGDLQVLGTVEVAVLTVSQNITVSGNIYARSIGQYYRVTNSSSSTSTAGTKSATASCDAAGPGSDTNDILISCGGRFTNATNTAFAGTFMSGVTCTVYGTQSTTTSRTLQAQAVCLNPDGDGEANLTGNPIESL